MRLQDLLDVYGQPELIEQLRRLQPADYDDFVDQLQKDLLYVIDLIEGDAKDFHDSSEDELNREIVRLLRARHYVAGHDHDEGGHVDIHVRSRDGKFSWLAEAKLDKGIAYLTHGVHQLSNRYARGTQGHNQGALIIYIQKDRCTDRFSTWREHFSSLTSDFEGLEVLDCAFRQSLSFRSRYVLQRMGASGPQYQVLHLAISAFRPASAAA
jgi:hypothetical protein